MEYFLILYHKLIHYLKIHIIVYLVFLVFKCKVTLHYLIRSISLHCNKLSNYKVNCILHKYNRICKRSLTVHNHLYKMKLCKIYLSYVRVLSISKIRMLSHFLIWNKMLILWLKIYLMLLFKPKWKYQMSNIYEVCFRNIIKW